jgi:hypothetical protein
VASKKQKQAFTDALAAHNTAMAGDAEMPPNPSPEEMLKRMAAHRKQAAAQRERVLRELDWKDRKKKR